MIPDDGPAHWATLAALALAAVAALFAVLYLAVRLSRRRALLRDLRTPHWPDPRLIPHDYIRETPHVAVAAGDLPYLRSLAGKTTLTRAETRFLTTTLGDQREDWTYALAHQGAFMAALADEDTGNGLVAKALGFTTRPRHAQAQLFCIRDDGTRVCAVFGEAGDHWAITYSDFAECADEWSRVLDSPIEIRHPRSGVIELFWDVDAPIAIHQPAEVQVHHSPEVSAHRSTEVPAHHSVEVFGLEPEDAVHDLGEVDDYGYTATSHKRLPDID